MVEAFILAGVGVLATVIVAVVVHRRQVKEGQKREAQLREDLAKVRAEAAGMEDLRKRNRELTADVKELTKKGGTYVADSSFQEAANSLEEDIETALDSLPAKVTKRKDELADVEEDEVRAQLLARNLDDAIRPTLQEALSLCHQAVSKACERGLVGCEELTPMEIPSRTMGSAAEVGHRRRDEQSGFRFVSAGGTEWNVFIELGYTKSPTDLAEWREAHDHWFPMIRIEENGKPLATVAFDPNTKEVRVASNMSSETDAIKEILAGRDGPSSIGPVLIYLLRRIRTREEMS